MYVDTGAEKMREYTGSTFNDTTIYQKNDGEWIEKPSDAITTYTNGTFLPSYITTSTSLQNFPYGYAIQDISAHSEIEELREMIARLTAKPYFMKIQCHNCGAPITIESSNHLVKCKYCHTAYFSGTQLVNAI